MHNKQGGHMAKVKKPVKKPMPKGKGKKGC